MKTIAIAVIGAWVMLLSLHSADPSPAPAMKPSYATVRMIRGEVRFKAKSDDAWATIKLGQKLAQGTTVECAKQCKTALVLRDVGAILGAMESTRLKLDKMEYAKVADDIVVHVELTLDSGSCIGTVKKLANASKYDVKFPIGVCGFDGAEFKVTADGTVYLLSGKGRVAYMIPGGRAIVIQLKPGQVCRPPTEGPEPRIETIPANDPVRAELRDGMPEIVYVVE